MPIRTSCYSLISFILFEASTNFTSFRNPAPVRWLLLVSYSAEPCGVDV
jgi:hypothetical protein